LRNPLMAIESFATFLEEDYAERLDDAGRDLLRRIQVAATKMESLIGDILSLSRVGRVELKKVDVDLSALVSKYLQELHSSQPERKADFIIQAEVQVHADKALIRIALENLLRNAWKFTSKKAVTKIAFGCFVKEGETIYYIRDNGAGFDKKFARSIFEPFKRVHAEADFRGTGIGLSIVQRVIQRHGGNVWAEGEVGQGATFSFTL
ncbi:MAG: PAS domain-containing sensor histidine kinase, partial [Chitinivibrionales bacterium]|nr:PAS domain-containing sensor histidine kinase [Chitinivibrionales bacterium]MBD3356870.1 PAS domain-containing sensor histidine kinase [Chitinivibrionales bacterium]